MIPVPAFEDFVEFLRALDPIGKGRGIHAGGNIHRVAPNVVLRLLGTDHSGNDWTHVQADAQHEIVVGIFINVGQLFLHVQHDFDKHGHVLCCQAVIVVRNSHLRDQSDGCHVCRADCFDLIDRPIGLLIQDLVEVSDDLVQQSQALHSLIVAVQFDVEFVEVGNRGKHDTHFGVGLVIQILRDIEKRAKKE